MAEKRKLPPRAGREPAAKRRVSEAVTATPQSHKKKTPTPRAPSIPPPPPEPVEPPLPTKVKDVEALPITRVRQPDTLSDKEYQSIAERSEPWIIQLISFPPGLTLAREIQCCTSHLLGTIKEEVA